MRVLRTYLFFGILLFISGCKHDKIEPILSEAEQIDSKYEASLLDLLNDGEDLSKYFGQNHYEGASPTSTMEGSRSSLSFNYDSADFLASCPDLSNEDFNEAPLLIFDCFDSFADPLDENSNDTFQPGDITSGISFSAIDNKGFDDPLDLSIVTNCTFLPDLAGEKVLIANYQLDDLIIDFDPAITAFGADFLRLGGGIIELEFIGDAGTLGNTSLSVNYDESSFLSVQSTDPITQIKITSVAGSPGPEGIDNIYFGTCDADGDGCPDSTDPHPNSMLDPNIVIDGCDSGVTNSFVNECSTMLDFIFEEGSSTTNKGVFLKAVKNLTKDWVKAGLITNQEKGQIIFCATQADLPLS